MSLVLYGFACFAKVFLSILQAKNVQYSLYVSAFLTSILMTIADIIYIRLLVDGDIVAGVIVGSLSNAVAVVLALRFHRKHWKT